MQSIHYLSIIDNNSEVNLAKVLFFLLVWKYYPFMNLTLNLN